MNDYAEYSPFPVVTFGGRAYIQFTRPLLTDDPQLVNVVDVTDDLHWLYQDSHGRASVYEGEGPRVLIRVNDPLHHISTLTAACSTACAGPRLGSRSSPCTNARSAARDVPGSSMHSARPAGPPTTGHRSMSPRPSA